MGLERNAAGDFPRVAPTAFVHETATLIGAVVVEAGVFIGPNAVLRADEPGPGGAVAPIVVDEEANVQDGVIMHALGGTSVRVGPQSSLAHGAIVHGPCVIGKGCFIGFHSVVFNAELGDDVIVMHQALVEGVAIPSGRFVPSMTAVCCQAEVCRLTPATPGTIAFARRVSRTNVLLAQAGLNQTKGEPSMAAELEGDGSRSRQV